MILPIQVIKDEFSVVIGRQFQIVAGGTFDGDRGVGKTDGNMVSLLGPGEVFNQVLRFGVCPLFKVGKFA